LARLIVASDRIVKPGTINIFKAAVVCCCGNGTIATDQATFQSAKDAGSKVLTEINGNSTSVVGGVIEEINSSICWCATGVNTVRIAGCFNTTAIGTACNGTGGTTGALETEGVSA
jgi:hypothetical protein